MIDKSLMRSLKEETGLDASTIYEKIRRKQQDLGFKVTKEQAAALVAADFGIDISKLLSPEELTELRRLPTQALQVVTRVVTKKSVAPSKIMQFASGLQVQDPFLSDKIRKEAGEMSGVYPIIYIFENSVRNFISSVLAKRYGAKWWDTQVGPKIQEKVRDRIKKEAANRWHGRRGTAPIFYTDINDLLSIIRDNWPDFVDLFSKQSWIESRINDIEMSRNIIAHNNPLDRHDIRRIEVYFEDWAKLLKAVKDKI